MRAWRLIARASNRSHERLFVALQRLYTTTTCRPAGVRIHGCAMCEQATVHSSPGCAGILLAHLLSSATQSGIEGAVAATLQCNVAGHILLPQI